MSGTLQIRCKRKNTFSETKIYLKEKTRFAKSMEVILFSLYVRFRNVSQRCLARTKLIHVKQYIFWKNVKHFAKSWFFWSKRAPNECHSGKVLNHFAIEEWFQECDQKTHKNRLRRGPKSFKIQWIQKMMFPPLHYSFLFCFWKKVKTNKNIFISREKMTKKRKNHNLTMWWYH